jgi:hypothetical protein
LLADFQEPCNSKQVARKKSYWYLYFLSVSVAFPFCQNNRISTTVEQVRVIVTRHREHVSDLLREQAKVLRCLCVCVCACTPQYYDETCHQYITAANGVTQGRDTDRFTRRISRVRWALLLYCCNMAINLPWKRYESRSPDKAANTMSYRFPSICPLAPRVRRCPDEIMFY